MAGPKPLTPATGSKPYGQTAGAVGEAMRSGRLTVAVYGLGKMGLPLAAAIGFRGARIVGADLSPDVVKSVNAGKSHVNEPGVAEAIAEIHRAGRLRATTDAVEAAKSADVHVIIVPTLLRDDKSSDLSAVLDIAGRIAKGLHRGDLVLLESTTPPGSTAGPVRKALEASGLEAGRDFGLAFCPERTLSGRALNDILRGHPKIVGGLDAAASEAARGFYEVLDEKGVLVVSSPTAAEAVKTYEGVYRDVNIALANELFLVSEKLGLDWKEVFDAANSQPYCHIHLPGAGPGGHCIPVYPWFVVHATAAPTPLIQTARRVNEDMVPYWVGRAEEALGTLAGKRVLVVGLTYRPGVAETRYTPALRIAEMLRKRGADVRGEDPLVETAAAPKPEKGWEADLALVLHGTPRTPAKRSIQIGPVQTKLP
ncbi:MAG: nucleotide sugar dehydrogenase [Thermoplasmatota archaeon]